MNILSNSDKLNLIYMKKQNRNEVNFNQPLLLSQNHVVHGYQAY